MTKDEIIKLIEDNGLTLHGDIEHFAALVAEHTYTKYLELPEAKQSGTISITMPAPIAYLCENATGHKYFRWKKPSSTYKPIPLYTTPPQQEPVAWMGTDVEGNPNKFRLNFFSGAIPLFTTPEDRSLVSTNEKNGSPCSEFWDWLPKAYNFEGDGVFTKYNMEVAFLAGKQNVATNDTLSERVDEMQKQRHDTTPPQRTWVGLTDEDRLRLWLKTESEDVDRYAFAKAIEAKLKEKNT